MSCWDAPATRRCSSRRSHPGGAGVTGVAGGTWLAVDPEGRIGAVTNRHPGGVLPALDASRRTRGTLPLDVLAGSDADALAWMESLHPGDFNPVNVLYASRRGRVLDVARRRARTPHCTAHPRHPCAHRAGARRPDRPQGDADPWASPGPPWQSAAGPDDLVLRLRDILRSHESVDAGSPACIHAERYGTVSSATVVVTADGVRYEHADGPPCVNGFKRVI